MTDKEAKDRLISLRTSYKIRIEEEDIEALDKGIEALENQSSVIEELEKTKAEIEKLEHLNIEDGSDGYDKYVEQYEVLTIINKRIAELKGENDEI